jgi:hypothetical protein
MFTPQDLDYTYSKVGDPPKYLPTLAFPPSYFHRVIRTMGTGNPVVRIDLSPWASDIKANLQVLQDKTRMDTFVALSFSYAASLTFLLFLQPPRRQAHCRALGASLFFHHPASAGKQVDQASTPTSFRPRAFTLRCLDHRP